MAAYIINMDFVSLGPSGPYPGFGVKHAVPHLKTSGGGDAGGDDEAA